MASLLKIEFWKKNTCYLSLFSATMKILLLSFTLLLLPLVSADCWCRSYPSDNGVAYGIDVGCNDYGMKAECDKAWWEYENFIASVMQHGDAILNGKFINGAGLNRTYNVTRASINRACLAKSLETAKPDIDCATGLFTRTDLEGLVHESNKIDIADSIKDDLIKAGKCISLPLLQQCQAAQTATSTFVSSVLSGLMACADTNFVNDLRIRIEDEGVPPTVSCKTTINAQENILNYGSAMEPNHVIYITMILLVYACCWG